MMFILRFVAKQRFSLTAGGQWLIGAGRDRGGQRMVEAAKWAKRSFLGSGVGQVGRRHHGGLVSPD